MKLLSLSPIILSMAVSTGCIAEHTDTDLESLERADSNISESMTDLRYEGELNVVPEGPQTDELPVIAWTESGSATASESESRALDRPKAEDDVQHSCWLTLNCCVAPACGGPTCSSTACSSP